MNLLIFPVVAFAPGLFWLWFFAKRHVYRPGPKRLLALTFLLGMAGTIPAAIIEVLLGGSGLDDSVELGTVAAGMLLVVGPTEEICKFLAVRLGAYRSLYFDEPLDGLVYAAAASLGFASLENLGYVAAFGPAVMLARAPLSTLGHVMFGSVWGYALGLRVRESRLKFRLATALGLVAAAAAHGTFNTLLWTGESISPAFYLVLIVLFALGFWWTLRRFAWARRVSPFRYRRNYPNVRCAGCGQLISVIGRYCRFCGSPSTGRRHEVFCSQCGSRSPAGARYCNRCGDQLLSGR